MTPRRATFILRAVAGLTLLGLLASGLVSSHASAAVPRDALPAGWTTTTAEHLLVHHREADAGQAASLVGDVRRVRRRFHELVGRIADLPVEVILLPSLADGEALGAPAAPEWAAGFTVSGSDVLFLRLDVLGVYPDRDLTSVFAHEFGHAVLGNVSGAHELPRWFEEGTCMVLARPWDLRDSLALTVAALFQPRQAFDRYAVGFPADAAAARAAYARSFSFVSWLVDRHGGVRRILAVSRRVGAGTPFPAAFFREYGTTPTAAARTWQASVGRWYRITSVLTASTTFWVAIVALVTLVFLRTRRRNRAILEQWEEEEGGWENRAGPIEPS